MSKDTIYREDAILAMANALWHYPNDCYKNLNVYEFAKALAELGLRSLPSAQPEITLESAIDYLHSIGWMQEHDKILSESAQPELIMCKDCKFAEREATSSNGMYWCILHGSYMRYCSDATRRTDADMRGEQDG